MRQYSSNTSSVTRDSPTRIVSRSSMRRGQGSACNVIDKGDLPLWVVAGELLPRDLDTQKLCESFANNSTAILQRMLGGVLVDGLDYLCFVGCEHRADSDSLVVLSRHG